MSVKKTDRAETGSDCGRPPRMNPDGCLTRHDLGLTPRETIEFFQWLREDPRHETAWENCLRFWRRFDPRFGREIMFSVYRGRRPLPDQSDPVRSRQKEH